MRKFLNGAALATLAATAMSAGVAGPALADTPTAAAPAQVSEVVVTARKRSERVQDTPVSVDVISAARLQEGDARDFKDVLRDIPGVSFSGAEFGQSRYNIRGVSTSSQSPTVGIYLDDVSLLSVTNNFSGAADPVFFDFSRVEVLKGPQGTLYGGSAMGGAIKYVSQAPRLGVTSLDVGAGLSSTDGGDLSYETQAVVNLPVLSDKLAIRGGFLYRSDGGYIDNVANAPAVNPLASATATPYSPVTQPSLSTRAAKAQNNDHVLGLRLSALWEPDPSLQITPEVFHQEYHQANSPTIWTNLPGNESSFRLPEPTNDVLGVYSLNAVKHFGGIDLTSLSGYVDRSVNWDRDYSFYVGMLAPALYGLNSPNASNSTTRTFTQELRLASSNPASRLKWTAGFYYSDEKDQLLQTVTTIGLSKVIPVGTDVVYNGDTSTHTRQYAAFGDVTYTILPKLDASVGVRLFRIEQHVDTTGDGLLNGGHTHGAGGGQEQGVNPKVSVDYHIAKDNMVYADAAKGFRPGGANPFAVAPGLCQADLQRLGLSSAPTTYQSDKLWTYEVGSKNQFLGRRITLNGAAYYTQWDNIQQSELLQSCGFSFTGNVGAAAIKGGELGGQAELIPGLTVGGGASYTDAQITRSAPGVSAAVGQSVLDTPKWIANGFASYRFPVWGGGVAIARADYQFHGSNLRAFESALPVITPSGPSTIPNFAQVQKAYDVVNFDLTLDYGRLQFDLFVNNAFNSAPLLDYNVISGLSQANSLRPRTVGLNMRAHF